MKNCFFYIVLSFCFSGLVCGQSISTSPYSMYGLGSVYDSDFGGIPGIGSSGLALPSSNFINNLNPASLGFMNQNHFLFYVGGKTIFTTFQNNELKESRNTMQFSHLAFAFPISKKSALSLALKPYSSSSFKISNLELPILDSQNYYTLNVLGSGGLNDLDFSYGYRVSSKWAVGFTGTFLFGTTTENREYYVANSVTAIAKESYFNGFRATVGTQIKIDSTLTLAATLKVPSQIKVSKVQSVATSNSTGDSTVATDEASDSDDYFLPFEFGVGISKVFKQKFNLTADYQRSFWTATNQSDSYGDFVNQNHFAVGLSYQKAQRSWNYWDQLRYSVGGNYNSGYLEINGNKVNDAALSLGVSFPLENNFSAINLSYSYGQRGRIGDGLVKENYHKISLNISLDGIWFLKRKID
ncbi:aromatic hydrocarbon degradation protein [Flavobacterium agrisoli]|uniref:Aromatic hydrocarbon degradation protein n=1 Tax=Flavobacterium agrisoli TaxID=2793066 RepID=A0A934PN22_9FLAO|nr:aromatic hydrocarbon degradation protein [Flavobacterium agrisoli]MBK0370284.1 aromatic hydrocarbon degradation protein [Flavobacterium agrisoli]